MKIIVTAVIAALSLIGCEDTSDPANDRVAECMTRLQMAGTDMSVLQQMDYCGHG